MDDHSLFAGLFIVVGGLDETGVIGQLAKLVIDMTKGHAIMTMMVLLWASALLSSVFGQHPIRGNPDSFGAGLGRERHRRYAAVVGNFLRRMPGRQRHTDRRISQCSALWYQRQTRLSNQL